MGVNIYKNSPAPTMVDQPATVNNEAEISDTEKWTRLGVNLGHLAGSIAIVAAGGSAQGAQALGTTENLALDSAFPHDKINPSAKLNQQIRKDYIVSADFPSNPGANQSSSMQDMPADPSELNKDFPA